MISKALDGLEKAIFGELVETVPKYLHEATKAVLAEREAELLELKGPCSSAGCELHYAHRGPCDIN